MPLDDPTARKIVIGKATVTRHGPGLLTRDAGEDALGISLSPFIFVSLYDMTSPTFPPHPHAGFSVATYILPESAIGFINQDSLGSVNTILPGALHWTTAGSGIIHEEQPERPGAMAQGYQIWVDHANVDRQIKPAAHHLPSNAVPVSEQEGATIRVVLGSSNGLTSPMATPTLVRVIDVKLAANAQFMQQLDDGENVFVVMIGGEVTYGDTAFHTDDVASFGITGGDLMLTAGPDGARFTLFAGQPLNNLRMQRGPFVGRNAQELQGFMNRYAAGEFGQVTPFAQQTPIAPNGPVQYEGPYTL
jgi:redox-sensitive bicupin YhaK (pirin superfamily)